MKKLDETKKTSPTKAPHPLLSELLQHLPLPINAPPGRSAAQIADFMSK
jgi:hypothetical protein